MDINICGDKFFKECRIQPEGFWTDVIRVSARKSYHNDNWSFDINWGSGGICKEVGHIKASDYFIEALREGQEVLRKWESELIEVQNKGHVRFKDLNSRDQGLRRKWYEEAVEKEVA